MLLHKDSILSDHDDTHEHIHSHEHTHCHDGIEHTHEHIHSHEHEGIEHTHSSEELHTTAQKEMQTLNILLDHWVEHNLSHMEGFVEWAKKAEENGKNDVKESINEAVEMLEKANDALKEAKRKMNL